MTRKNQGPSSGDYEVGRGKPPKKTRFQPGQSGNPKGRPKGSTAMKTLIDKELNQKVSIKENGRPIELSKRHLLAKTLVNKALSGDLRAVRALKEYGISITEEAREEVAAVSAEALADEDQAIFDRYFKGPKDKGDDDAQ